MPTDDLTLRPATQGDLDQVAALHIRAREQAVPVMPPLTFTAEEVRRYVGRWDLATHALWLAEGQGRLLGYAMVHEAWLHSLYVDPPAQGNGIGAALLDLAKSLRPAGFCLYVFESNTPARGFYARHGLTELETTDGSANPENAPDVRMVWPGEHPLAFLRDLIDDVDDQLGDLLARRAALTRAVQQHKQDLSRDPEREREIVRRLAERVPELGEERLARIVHAIISESLEAVDEH